MPRLTKRPPKLCRHPNGQAYVKVQGRARYLGKAGTAEAEAAYRRFVVQCGSTRLDQIPAPSAEAHPTVAELVARFHIEAEARYQRLDGTPSREAPNWSVPLRLLNRQCGELPVSEVGPRHVREIRDQLLKAGEIGRRTINRHVHRLARFLAWCSSLDLYPADRVAAVKAIPPLRAHQGRETPGRRRPVDRATVDATLPHCSPMLAGFIEALWHTGARVGEIRELRTADIDRSGPVWIARLSRHKTSHRQQGRTLLFDCHAQAALAPFLKDDAPTAPIFGPPGEATATTYRRCSPGQALRRICQRHGIEPWQLAQLRHSAGTRITERHGVEVARILLGHSHPSMTAHYSAEAIAHCIRALTATT